MAIVPDVAAGFADVGAVTLPRYAKLIGYTECAFFGVNHPDNIRYACREIWTKAQRDNALKYLLMAQSAIENVVRFPLAPTWVVGQSAAGVEDRLVDQQRCGTPVTTRWAHVIQFGQKAEADIMLAAPVDHTADPATIGPIATSVTDVDEVHLYLPGTDIEVHPSALTIAGGNLTAQVPRCRTVAEAYLDNPEVGLDYNDVALFAATLDVKREYCDPSVQASLVSFPRGCGDDAPCEEDVITACAYLRNPELGIVALRPASYADGAWTDLTTVCCRRRQVVRLWYQAGLRRLTYEMEDAVVRLAHAMMPNEPCGCAVVLGLWRRDRAQPEVATRERLNCPWGLNDGSWVAFQTALKHQVLRSYLL